MEPFKYVLAGEFLEEVRKAIQQYRLQYIPRPCNEDWLAKLGFTRDDVERIVQSLKPENCIDGGLDDLDSNYDGTVWIFKKSIQGKLTYIKLKLDTLKKGRRIAKCLSFHEDATYK